MRYTFWFSVSSYAEKIQFFILYYFLNLLRVLSNLWKQSMLRVLIESFLFPINSKKIGIWHIFYCSRLCRFFCFLAWWFLKLNWLIDGVTLQKLLATDPLKKIIFVIILIPFCSTILSLREIYLSSLRSMRLCVKTYHEKENNILITKARGRNLFFFCMLYQ